jgi:hypothetical protein
MAEATPSAQLERERSVVEIFDHSLQFMRRHPVLCALLAAVVFVPYVFVELLVTGSGPLARSRGGGPTAEFLFAFLPTTLVYPLISAFQIRAMVIIDGGARAKVTRVLRDGVRVLPVVLAAEIMANLGIIVGLVLLIVPGIVLSLFWAVTAQCAAVEATDWISALRQSGTLVYGNLARVFVVWFVPSLLVALVEGAASTLPLGSRSGAASVALGIVIGVVGASFVALTTTLLYYDLRARAAFNRGARTPR